MAGRIEFFDQWTLCLRVADTAPAAELSSSAPLRHEWPCERMKVGVLATDLYDVEYSWFHLRKNHESDLAATSDA
jgi:hypothetical protein